MRYGSHGAFAEGPALGLGIGPGFCILLFFEHFLEGACLLTFIGMELWKGC